MGLRTLLSPKEREKVQYPIKVFILERRKGKFEIDDKERGRRVFDENGNEYLELKLRGIRLMPHHYGEIVRTRDGDLAVFLYAHGPEEIYPVDFKFLVEQEYTDPHTGETVKARAFMPINLQFGEIVKTGQIVDLEAIPKVDPKARQWFAQQLRENEILYPTKKGPSIWVQALPWVVLLIMTAVNTWILLKVIDIVPVMEKTAELISQTAPVLEKIANLLAGAG